MQHIRRLPTSLLVQRLQGLVECGDTHATSSFEAATGRRRRSGHGRGAVGITPAAEDALEIPRSTLKNDCGDWHKRPVLHASGEDAVLLRKVQRVTERDILRLRFGPDNDVKLKEGIEDVDTSSLQILLREGRNLRDLYIVEWSATAPKTACLIDTSVGDFDSPVASSSHPSGRDGCSTCRSLA